MKSSILFISIFLSLDAYDLNLFRRPRSAQRWAGVSVSLDQVADPIRHRKRSIHHKPNVVPPWLRGKRQILRTKCKYLSVKSRDARDSDQRKIRRRFNNA